MRISATISTTIIHPLSVKFLFAVMLLEIFLGGGGRLIDVGPLSIRMYLFILALIISVAEILNHRTIYTTFAGILIAATVMFLFSSIIGKLNGATTATVLADIKPLLTFYGLIFFYFMIRDLNDVDFVVRLLKFCSITLAILYVGVFVLINTHILPFALFYSKVTVTQEFFFRGEFAFFYKGFIYMCFGAIFYACEKKALKAPFLLLAVAIILTFTRGFFVSILLTFLFYHVFIVRNASKLILFLIATMVAVMLLWGYYYQKSLGRSTSDSVRVEQVQEVIERTTPLSSIIGHGYGVGVPSRPERMEIVYLELFHKQGIFGLLFWFALALVVWQLYKRALTYGNNSLANAFMLSVVFVYVESITNPFLTNPIGLNMVLIAMVCLKVLGGAPREVLPSQSKQ
ncbi:hypothetical protein WBG78_13175 [Chryseolinea sp. T2]|uniref:hypothetical protein n=1 Tax=Chryseolinea sp. T2 TaxID=3129255 RepID=UPI003077845D